jgi:hypothetical protein
MDIDLGGEVFYQIAISKLSTESKEVHSIIYQCWLCGLWLKRFLVDQKVQDNSICPKCHDTCKDSSYSKCLEKGFKKLVRYVSEH